MDFIKRFFSDINTRRFIVLVLIGLLLYFIKGMLNVVLLTFLIAFIMNSIQIQLHKRISKFVTVNSKVIVILLYLILIALIIASLVNYLPKIYEQMMQLTTFLTNLSPDDLPQNKITLYLFDTINSLNYQSYLKNGIDYVLKISNWGSSFVLSIILSFIFILEKNRIVTFTSKLESSKLAWFYIEVKSLGKKFVSSFGKVIEAQILIALLNTTFSVLGLLLLGYPYLFALSIMIFLLSLIPVVGFLISLVPLCIIGYTIGGIDMVFYVLVMISVLHFVEGYFLNPKLMASKMDLPMFYTLVVLLFSEHYIGVWGLIVGIPIFIFFLDILEVNRKTET
ncbi:AI-2E family transporter [Paenibacillus illinoisensis]